MPRNTTDLLVDLRELLITLKNCGEDDQVVYKGKVYDILLWQEAIDAGLRDLTQLLIERDWFPDGQGHDEL